MTFVEGTPHASGGREAILRIRSRAVHNGRVFSVLPSDRLNQHPDKPMHSIVRLILCRCSVSYVGRGRTTLQEGTRLVMLKRDGSVSIHSDDRAYKPLNWMLSPCLLEETTTEGGTFSWKITSKKDELTITFHEIIWDVHHDWESEEPGLQRQWTESDLQTWIADNVTEVFGLNWNLVGREYPTGAGPVDVLVTDPEGNAVAVEVKRTAHMPAVDQVMRYVAALRDGNQDGKLGDIRGVIVALEFKDATRRQAERNGVECIEVTPNREDAARTAPQQPPTNTEDTSSNTSQLELFAP